MALIKMSNGIDRLQQSVTEGFAELKAIAQRQAEAAQRQAETAERQEANISRLVATVDRQAQMVEALIQNRGNL